MKMKKTVLLLCFVYVFLAFTQVHAEENSVVLQNSKSISEDSRNSFENRRFFIGSSVFILYNLIPGQDNPPDFYQLNFGYWLTEKDVISLELITWKYNEPLGIPFGPSFGDPNEAYPGYIREFGIGIAYQRHLWKGLYTAVHALPLYQIYMNEDNEKIQNGFLLFCTLRLGYHLSLFNDRFFIEPSIAGTFWPINTNVPGAFKELEDKWPNYNLLEPGLHFGFKF
jgi:hypothetical protein